MHSGRLGHDRVIKLEDTVRLTRVKSALDHRSKQGSGEVYQEVSVRFSRSASGMACWLGVKPWRKEGSKQGCDEV